MKTGMCMVIVCSGIIEILVDNCFVDVYRIRDALLRPLLLYIIVTFCIVFCHFFVIY